MADNVPLAHAHPIAHPIAQPTIPKSTVQLGSIQVPDYYTQPIDPVTKTVYNLFGIVYIHVRNGANDYYIYEGSLVNVVKKLNLQL